MKNYYPHQELEIPVKSLTSSAHVPLCSKRGDGACDLRSTSEAVIAPLARELISTGLSMEIPMGFAGLVLPRSGLAIEHGITCLNSPGLIDSGYRGEIKVILFNSDRDHAFRVRIGDRIAQLAIVGLPEIHFAQRESLTDSERGTGGFGHTGLD